MTTTRPPRSKPESARADDRPVQDAITPNTGDQTELVLARSIGAFALLLIALALPDLLQVGSSRLGLEYVVFVVLIPVLTIATMIPKNRGGLRRMFAGTVAWMILLGFLLWHLGLIGNGLSPDARPWSWGIAGAGVGLAAVARNNKMAVGYGLLFSVLVLIIPLLPAGSARQWSDSWQDSLLTIAMTLVIVAPIWALRGAVGAQDRAAVEAVQKFAGAARLEAVSVERARLDALTHDIVLSTLIVASQATTRQVLDASRVAAVAALAQLESVKHDDGTSDGGTVTLAEWLGRLAGAVAGSAVVVESPVEGQPVPAVIPVPVARALNQSAAEAVRNAVKHAPGVAVRLRVEFPGHQIGRAALGLVVVEIEDDGPGFDVDAIPLERMGVKVSIMGRMHDAGGSARIISSPGAGTLVRLQWEQGRGGNGPHHQ